MTMESENRSCPICGLEATLQQSSNRDAFTVRCRRCGQFLMAGILIRAIETKFPDPADDELKPYLSAHTRQSSDQGTITGLDIKNWREFAKTHLGTAVSTKIEKLLRLLKLRTKYPGSSAEYQSKFDYPVLDAETEEEAEYLIEHLERRGYVECYRDEGKKVYRAKLTVEGWSRLDPPAGAAIPETCFIAMSFDPRLNQAWENGIKPAVMNCGYNPVRVDKVHHNEKICDKIIAEIRFCQFMVADFTMHKPGVYFEVGYAMGLGRPVIWMCQKKDLTKAHFDTRQYNHIVWETPVDLKTQLSNRIQATIRR